MNAYKTNLLEFLGQDFCECKVLINNLFNLLTKR